MPYLGACRVILSVLTQGVKTPQDTRRRIHNFDARARAVEPLPTYTDGSSLLSCEHKNNASLYATMNTLIISPEVALYLKSVAKTARKKRREMRNRYYSGENVVYCAKIKARSIEEKM